MSFADPRWLWALLALPPVLLLEWLALRRAGRALARLVGERRDHVLLLQRRAGERRLGGALRLAALALLVAGAAGPEWGREVVRRTATGSDVVLMMDVSASMGARDVAPSRLDEARREAVAVLDRVGGSRVGVVAFAGDAVRLCPLTLDRGAARLTLESLSSASVSTPGTDLGRALRMAARVMPPGRRDEQAIVLWTDGEDLEQGARGALDELAPGSIRVFAVGVGTPVGGVVPVRDAQGRTVDVKRDASGAPVRSRLDEELLRTIARRSHGGYFAAAGPGGELPRLLASLGSVGRSARGARLVERPMARFRLFGFLAAVLLALDLARRRRRREAEREAGSPLHSERAAAAALLVALALLAPPPAAAQSAWARGDRAFRRGRWADAESLYARRVRRGGPDAVRVNLATVRAAHGQAERGAAELSALAARDTRAGRVAGYNLGTLLGGRGQVDPALAALRGALERDPGDADARWNYEVLLRRRQPAPPPPRSGGSGTPPPGQRPQPGGGGGGPASAQPNAGRGPQPLPQPPSAGTPRPGEGGGQMTRSQADRLLGALEEQARAEQQGARRVRAGNERRGRDW
ncbi:MAG: VWA domain-containing protein [Candidatus Eisenbacteria bacterium]|nr:VWA domain-containing protein [Candidatus Eisenbacteria bacterium]